MTSLRREAGFSLIELLVVIVVVGILVSVAMQSMDVAVNDFRTLKTEREMEMLSRAIVGDPSLTNGHVRTDFGYVGDIGAFPSNLQALYQNPGGYSTWDGPYLASGYTQDATGYRFDEWGKAYSYTGGTTISSTGGGATIIRKVADATSDYLLNTFNGTVWDINDRTPGTARDDSVEVVIMIPNGSGGTTSRMLHPDSTGDFTLDSLPAGTHQLRIIYTPEADTIFRYLTILPRHKSSGIYNFAEGYFTTVSGGGGGEGGNSMIDTLRPNGSGSITNLSSSGCGSNYQCVDESSSDGDATRVTCPSSSYLTDVYAMTNPGTGSGTIDSIIVHCLAKKSKVQGDVQPTIYVGGTEYNGTAQSLTTSYADYSQTWTTNPGTGVVWTFSDINNLQAGIRISAQNSNFPSYCTQVWVELHYTD